MASNRWHCGSCQTENSYKHKHCCVCGTKGRPPRTSKYLLSEEISGDRTNRNGCCQITSGACADVSRERTRTKNDYSTSYNRQSRDSRYNREKDTQLRDSRYNRGNEKYELSKDDRYWSCNRGYPRKSDRRAKQGKDDDTSDEEEFPLGVPWTCDNCTYRNAAGKKRCVICQLRNTSNDDDAVGKSKARERVRRKSWESEDIVPDDELRIVMIGKTGSGKSATGNTILNDDIFKSELSGVSVTKRCKRGISMKDGKQIYIVDTPGIQDTNVSNDVTLTEIAKCVGLSAPGPHVFLLILRVGRFTAEEKDSVDDFMQHFGKHVKKYTIIVFTGKDELMNESLTLQEHIRKAPLPLRKVVEECNGRCIAFNNRASSREKTQQVDDLLEMIEDMVSKNRGRYYTNGMFREAETAVRIREAEIRSQQEVDKKLEKERIEKSLHAQYTKQLEQDEPAKQDLQNKLKEMESVNEKLKDVDKDINKVRHEIQDSKVSGKNIDPKMQDRLDNLEKERSRLKKSVKNVETMQSEIQHLQKQLSDWKTRESRIRKQWDENLKKQLSKHDKKFKVLESNSRDVVRSEVEKGESGIGELIKSSIAGLGKMLLKGLTSFNL